MVSPTRPKHIKRNTADTDLRNAFLRPSRDRWLVSKEELRESAQQAKDEVELGRHIGIVLHWTIIKPLIVTWWVLKNAHHLMMLSFFLTLAWFIGLILFLTFF